MTDDFNTGPEDIPHLARVVQGADYTVVALYHYTGETNLAHIKVAADEDVHMAVLRHVSEVPCSEDYDIIAVIPGKHYAAVTPESLMLYVQRNFPDVMHPET